MWRRARIAAAVVGAVPGRSFRQDLRLAEAVLRGGQLLSERLGRRLELGDTSVVLRGLGGLLHAHLRLAKVALRGLQVLAERRRLGFGVATRPSPASTG